MLTLQQTAADLGIEESSVADFANVGALRPTIAADNGRVSVGFDRHDVATLADCIRHCCGSQPYDHERDYIAVALEMKWRKSPLGQAA